LNQNQVPDVEQTRLRLAIRQLDTPPERLEVVHLESIGLQSLLGIEVFCNVRELYLRNNKIETLNFRVNDRYVFEYMPYLTLLDLRDNRLMNLKEDIQALSQVSSLRSLYLQNSTQNKDTDKPSKYVNSVCSILRQLETIDGCKNPFIAAVGSTSIFKV
jgi:Leucine-rich repeat (LRR) protein